MVEIKKDDPELRKSLVCNKKAKEEIALLSYYLKKFSYWSRGARAITRLKRRVKEYNFFKERPMKV